jgi:hypothetical protein
LRSGRRKSIPELFFGDPRRLNLPGRFAGVVRYFLASARSSFRGRLRVHFGACAWTVPRPSAACQGLQADARPVRTPPRALIPGPPWRHGGIQTAPWPEAVAHSSPRRPAVWPGAAGGSQRVGGSPVAARGSFSKKKRRGRAALSRYGQTGSVRCRGCGSGASRTQTVGSVSSPSARCDKSAPACSTAAHRITTLPASLTACNGSTSCSPSHPWAGGQPPSSGMGIICCGAITPVVLLGLPFSICYLARLGSAVTRPRPCARGRRNAA